MAGSITQTWYETGVIRKVVFACTADAAAATFPDTVLSTKIDGYLLKIVTDPGATAPTADYDITIEDDEALDVLESQALNRHTSNTEFVSLASGTYFHPVVSKADTLTLKIANNSVNSATVDITLYYSVASG